MPSKSKTKGNSWEREVSSFLSTIYNSNFIRIPTSGAFVGGKNNFRKEAMTENQISGRKGDIQPPDDWKKWSCECKSYADFPFHQLLSTDVKILDEWIAQVNEASDANDFNIIFMKFNRKGKWIAFEKKCMFSLERGIAYKGWIFCSWDQFWKHPQNIQLVKSLSINGISVS